jgi:hypothetical protein
LTLFKQSLVQLVSLACRCTTFLFPFFSSSLSKEGEGNREEDADVATFVQARRLYKVCDKLRQVLKREDREGEGEENGSGEDGEGSDGLVHRETEEGEEADVAEETVAEG